MGKKEREIFSVKNDPDIRIFKKSFFVIVYVGLLLITLSLINTIIIGFTHGYNLHTSLTTTTYNYGFSQDTLLNVTNPTLINSTNSNYQVNYTEIYNATFSFTSDTIGNAPSGWVDADESNCESTVIAEKSKHNKVLQLYDNSATYHAQVYDTFSTFTTGTIELWVRIDTTEARYIDVGEDSAKTDGFSLVRLYNGNIDDANLVDVGDISTNTWTHFKFVITIGSLIYDIYKNGVLIANDVSIPTTPAYIGALFLRTRQLGTTNYNFWIDGIGYSWDTDYQINDNLIPVHSNTNVTQIAYWDFQHTESGIFSHNINPIPYWDEIGIGDFSETWDGEVNFLTQDVANGLVGMEKTFDYSDGLFNVTWKDYIDYTYPYGSNPDAFYSTSVYSQSLDLLVQINITKESGTFYLKYYNGSGYTTLDTGLSIETYYVFNLFVNNKLCVLDVNESDRYIFESLASTEGLGKVIFEQAQLANDGLMFGSNRYIDYVGIYVNGTSIASDFISTIIDLNIDTFRPKHYSFLDIKATGNFTLTLGDNSYDEVIKEWYNYTNVTETINIYNYNPNYTVIGGSPPFIPVASNPYLALTTNQTISVSLITLYSGIVLTDGIEYYYSDITYYNLTNNDINFTKTSTGLSFNATFNGTTNQFARFNFLKHQLYLVDYVIITSAYINSTGALCELSLNYVSAPSNNYSFSYTTQSYSGYINEGYLNEIIITISDNPNDNLNRSTSGYLNNFTLYYVKYYVPVIPTADNWTSLIIIVACVFPVPIILFIRLKKRYPDEKHDMLKYLIPAIVGCIITTALYFGNINLMPLFVYITLFVGFFLLILPSMLNRYLTLGLMFVSLMVYGGYFPSWMYVITLLIVSFTTILTVKNMKFGDR